MPSELNDVMSLLGAIASGGPREKLDMWTAPNYVKVSTVLTSDCGWETAIQWDGEHYQPVERYRDKAEAKAGHERWKERAKKLVNGDTIDVLGYGETIAPETMTITELDS